MGMVFHVIKLRYSNIDKITFRFGSGMNRAWDVTEWYQSYVLVDWNGRFFFSMCICEVIPSIRRQVCCYFVVCCCVLIFCLGVVFPGG